MDEQRAADDDSKLIKLDQLQAALTDDRPWSREDRLWLLTEVRKAWSRLADAEAWVPVDPSRIG